MAVDEAWGRNLRSAKRAYEERHDTRLTYKEIGIRVARAAGRGKPFGHSAVLNWFENGQEPEAFNIVRAIAATLETDVAALFTPQMGQNVNHSHMSADVPRDEKESALDRVKEAPIEAFEPVERPSKHKKRRTG